MTSLSVPKAFREFIQSVWGIAGFSGNFENALLYAMTDIVSHRGPDDQGVWRDTKVGIGSGHRRFAIQGLTES